MGRAIIIRDDAGKEFHRIDVTGRGDAYADKALRGLLRQMDTDRYTAAVEDVE